MTQLTYSRRLEDAGVAELRHDLVTREQAGTVLAVRPDTPTTVCSDGVMYDISSEIIVDCISDVTVRPDDVTDLMKCGVPSTSLERRSMSE